VERDMESWHAKMISAIEVHVQCMHLFYIDVSCSLYIYNISEVGCIMHSYFFVGNAWKLPAKKISSIEKLKNTRPHGNTGTYWYCKFSFSMWLSALFILLCNFCCFSSTSKLSSFHFPNSSHNIGLLAWSCGGYHYLIFAPMKKGHITTLYGKKERNGRVFQGK
jgi:hypothetical protein